MKAVINKNIRENSALSTIGIVIGIIICFIPFTSWVTDLSIPVVADVVPYGCMLIGLTLVVMGIKTPFEKRPRIYYNGDKGKYNLDMNRSYYPYKVSRARALIGGYLKWGWFIKFFEYENNILKVTTNNGKEIQAPLNELEVILKDNRYGMLHAYILLKHDDSKLKLCHNSVLFDEWEIEDMNKILSYAKEVKVERWLKIKFPSFKSKDMPALDMRKNAEGLKNLYSEDRDVFRKAIADPDERENDEDEKEEPVFFFDKYVTDERTEQEKQADVEISELIANIKSEAVATISISEDNLKNIIKNSSEKGFEKLFSVYDKFQKRNTDSPKKKTLINASVLKNLWGYYQDYAYFNRIEGEYVWLAVYFGAILSGISIIFLTLARGLSIWGYILWILGILVGSFILCIVGFSIYSDKIDKNKKIFLSTRAEVVDTGRFPKSDLETFSVGIKSLERQFKFFNYFCWFLGLLFIVLMLWRSHL